MKICQKTLLAAFLAFFACTSNGAEDSLLTAKFYESMFRNGHADMAELTLFFTGMPKGGDLHHHYTGSLYAETYLDWVDRKGWWINPCTFRIVKAKEEGNCSSITVRQLEANNALYRKLLDLWSDKDFSNYYHDQPPPDSNFFGTFGYFGTVSNEYMHEGLDILKQRALRENVGYIETMLARVPVSSQDYFEPDLANQFIGELKAAKSQEETDRLLDRITSILDGESGFHKKVDDYVSTLHSIHQGIDSDAFLMRYQTYASRGDNPLQVFTSLLAGFMVSRQSPLVVGVNIVGPENGIVALEDYTLHMRMFNYLHRKFPEVHRALHAGELTLGMVQPKDLQSHIREAVEIAHAQRIGHGVDLPHEWQAPQLLQELKKEKVAIEINLTSNQFILGVLGSEHPYPIYAAYGIPLVISTDDSGVSRNNLSEEYMLLASRYHPSYEKIKEYVYNSIRYSFLPPAARQAELKILDRRFEEFEKEMASFSAQMNLK